MPHTSLTLRALRARPVVLKLKRPVVARIATITDWPLILIDLEIEEGVVGRAYLEPYLPRALRYLVPMLQDLGTQLAGRPVAPVELFDAARRSLQFVGYGGLAMIAAAKSSGSIGVTSSRSTAKTWRYRSSSMPSSGPTSPRRRRS